MAEKRKIECVDDENHKKFAGEVDVRSEFEHLPLELRMEIFNYLKGNDLKNLFLVNKNINTEVNESQKLMKKLVLNIGKVNWTEFHATRNYFNFKVKSNNFEILVDRKDQLLHKFVESSVIFEDLQCSYVLEGLKNDEETLLNLEGLKRYDPYFQMTSKGDKIWKLKSINATTTTDKFYNNIIRINQFKYLEEFALKIKDFSDFALFHVFNKMRGLDIRSLKRFVLIQAAFEFTRVVEPLLISPFIASVKSTLQAVHLDGIFDPETCRILLNETPNLRDLIVAPFLNEDHLVELDTVETNQTVETYYYKLPSKNKIFSNCFTKLSNLKVLYINQNESTSEVWQSMMENMTKLHTVHLMQRMQRKFSVFRENLFPNVKTLFMFKTCTEAQWKIIADSFPKIETLRIYHIYHKKDNFDIIPRAWQTLKHVEFGEGLQAPIASFIKMLRDFPGIETVVMPPEAIIWDMSRIDFDLDIVDEFMENGLALFTLDVGVKERYENLSLKSLNEKFSFSSGTLIEM